MTGIFNVDKPKGLTSAAVVAKIKRLTGGARTGHMGTLDPQGTGVLLVGVGRATRLFDHLLKKDKEAIILLQNLQSNFFAHKTHNFASRRTATPNSKGSAG